MVREPKYATMKPDGQQQTPCVSGAESQRQGTQGMARRRGKRAFVRSELQPNEHIARSASIVRKNHRQ